MTTGTQDTMASGAPLTDKRQLMEYCQSGCKSRQDWRIGTENEKFPFRLSDLRPVTYAEAKGMRELLLVLKIYGWREIWEEETLIGLSRGQARIALEPSCQLELSGAPFLTLHETAAELENHLEELQDVSRLLDIGFLSLGFHPTASLEELSWAPKPRYARMREYLPRRGSRALDMMQRTCSTQVNLDYDSETDMARKMRLAMALQPIATALFAASPFADGKPTGYQSWRMKMWQETDPDRCGVLPFVFDGNFGFERYVDYALDVPMIFVLRDGRYIDVSGQTFRDFMAGKLAALSGALPMMEDWIHHLSALFPDVRLKQYLELRAADCGHKESILAVPSFWTGLLYDAAALDAALELIGDWTIEDHHYLKQNVPQHGLKLPFRTGTVCDIAHRAVILAQQGLRRRARRLNGGVDETCYLDRLLMMTESGNSYADELVTSFNHAWQGDIMQVYKNCRL